MRYSSANRRYYLPFDSMDISDNVELPASTMSQTNLKKLERLKYRVWTQQHSLVLQHYLQGRNIPIGGTMDLNELFKKAVLVTLCCNRTTVSPYKLSDIGITTYVK
ncbi:hypothetical protein SLS60_002266 [Paraconiothyrium brasiliense]|uniref:Uncharacterized protein n=1 Tax=Paraconiothyrium brasiliense TaxID=300254 RepID=A0ABR3S1N2_9PLEO